MEKLMTDYALQGMLLEDVVQSNQTPADLLNGAWSGLKFIKEFSPGDYIEALLWAKFELGSAHAPMVTLTLKRGSTTLLTINFSAPNDDEAFYVKFSLFCRQGGTVAELVPAAVAVVNGQTSYAFVGAPVQVDATAEDDFVITSVTDVGTTTVTAVGAAILYP